MKDNIKSEYLRSKLHEEMKKQKYTPKNLKVT